MLDLLEMMRKAHGGEAISGLAESFGLSQKMADDMLKAYMPAFSEALRRAGDDPMAWKPFFSGLSTDAFTDYYKDAARAFSPDGMAEGQKLLAQMFQAPGMSDAIAAQVAAMTGGAPESALRMFPALATMFMGGLAQQMPAGPAREAMEHFMQGFSRGRPEPSALDPFAAFAPMAEGWNGFLRAFTPSGPAASTAETSDPKAEAPAGGPSDNSGQSGSPFQFLDEMITAGQSIQQAQISAIQDMMQGFWPKQK